MLKWVLILALVAPSLADLPIDCRHADVVGLWEFSETKRDGDSSLTCDKLGAVEHTTFFEFVYPNIVTDEIGNVGTWTLVYNQGIEVNINERSYWAPFYYSSDGFSCDSLSVGWARDSTVRHWSCFSANKLGAQKVMRKSKISKRVDENSMFKNEHGLIGRINSVQSSWTAKAYPEHEKYTVKDMLRRSGGLEVRVPTTAPVTEEQLIRANTYPENFDWRNVNGVNYVSPVEDQGSCGSCYSFASAGMLESRIRIVTNMTRQDIFSKQDIVTCSALSEGCDGGFAYLTAGRYAMEQGMADQSCNTYTAADNELCDTRQDCPRTYVSAYGYVGGYYGGANALLMQEELLVGGPVAVGFMVFPDFNYYQSGVYHHTEAARSAYDPFYAVSHAVLLVGYGVDPESGEKFWTAKNSWGEHWGEDGYFRIRRGNNEVGFESMPLAATIIP